MLPGVSPRTGDRATAFSGELPVVNGTHRCPPSTQVGSIADPLRGVSRRCLRALRCATDDRRVALW